eukprot:scaffold1342_cov204-Pinguiococcus_pyrenoidosus.AAC.14
MGRAGLGPAVGRRRTFREDSSVVDTERRALWFGFRASTTINNMCCFVQLGSREPRKHQGLSPSQVFPSRISRRRLSRATTPVRPN